MTPAHSRLALESHVLRPEVDARGSTGERPGVGRLRPIRDRARVAHHSRSARAATGREKPRRSSICPNVNTSRSENRSRKYL